MAKRVSRQPKTGYFLQGSFRPPASRSGAKIQREINAVLTGKDCGTDCECVRAGECNCHRMHVTERCECPSCQRPQTFRRSHSTKKTTDAHARGEDAYKNIQSEARGAESEARMADHAADVAAQRGPWPAHSLVGLSEQHAEQAAKFVAHAQGWVREARGTPQFAAVERVLASVRGSAARAKAHAASTKRAFEARFGKYDPRGLRSSPKNHATMKNRQSPWRKGESALFWIGPLGWRPVKIQAVTAAKKPKIIHPVTGKLMVVQAKASLKKVSATPASR